MRPLHGSVLRISAISALVVATVVVGAGFAAAEPGFSPMQVMPVPVGIQADDVAYYATSCGSPTSCTAVGYAGIAAIVVTESSGTWGTPQAITLPSGGVSGSLDAVTCPSTGDCLATGVYATSGGATEPLLASESSGMWDAATSATPPAAALTGSSEDAGLTAAWCASAGSCEAVGFYKVSGGSELPMALIETSGAWGAATALPADPATSYGDHLALACTSSGDCTAVAPSTAWAETTGTWGAPTMFAQPRAPDVTFLADGVACPSATTCIAVGSQVFNVVQRNPTDGAAVTETAGTWGAPEPVQGTGLAAISCQSAVCVAVGDDLSTDDFDTYIDPIAVTWSSGTWSSAGVMPFVATGPKETNASAFSGVACASATHCLGIGLAATYHSNGGPYDLYPYSTDLTTVRPIVAPAAPRGVYAAPLLGGAQVWWQPPLDDGGAAITSFTATATPGGQSCTAGFHTCAISGLVNGRRYLVRVNDSNGTFSSPAIASNYFFAGVVPSTPGHLSAGRSDGAASISWHPSITPNGEPVLRYLVQTQVAGHERTECVTTVETCTVGHLARGNSYAVLVIAVDATGRSSPGRIQFFAR